MWDMAVTRISVEVLVLLIRFEFEKHGLRMFSVPIQGGRVSVKTYGMISSLGSLMASKVWCPTLEKGQKACNCKASSHNPSVLASCRMGSFSKVFVMASSRWKESGSIFVSTWRLSLGDVQNAPVISRSICVRMVFNFLSVVLAACPYIWHP